MKFLRFKNQNKEIKTGYLENNEIFELKKDILCYFNDSEIYTTKNVHNDIVDIHELENVKIISPVKPSKIVCVGLNYKDHAKELDMDIPDTPKLFIKPSTSVIGNNDCIIKPEMSEEIDYEGELAIIIGKTSKNIEINEAKEFIFGYTIINDVTARDIQRYDEQWTRGKSFDTFAPIGPVIENNLNPNNLKITTTIISNDNKNILKEVKQHSNTSNMIFKPYELVSFISKVMTLNPGDVIATGTPPGVGKIKVGETVEVEIEKIGILSNKLSE